MLKSEILKNLNAEELYNSGKTLEEISKLADCDISTVREYLIKNNVQIRSRGVQRQLFKIGEIIGNWEVLSEEVKDSETKAGHRSYSQYCKCIRCGYEAWVELNKYSKNPKNKCVKCKSSKVLKEDGSVDYDYIFDYWFNRHILRMLERRKKVSTLDFNITKDYIQQLYFKQNGKCALSGINLNLKVIKLDDLELSLDRINSDIGYVKGNVQWVHKDINMMKQSYNNDYFIEMCCKIAENNGYSKCS